MQRPPIRCKSCLLISFTEYRSRLKNKIPSGNFPHVILQADNRSMSYMHILSLWKINRLQRTIRTNVLIGIQKKGSGIIRYMVIN